MLFKKKSTKEMVQGGSAEPPMESTEKPKKKQKKEKPKKDYNRPTFFRTKVFYGILSICLGLAVSLAGIPMLRSAVTETVEVVCFGTNVKAGALLTRDMLDTVELSSYHLPSGAIQSVESVVGQYVLVDAISGDVVTLARLSSQHPGTDPTLLALPEGKMALSISLPDLAQSVSGKLRGGDVIQIFAMESGNTELIASAPSELRYVEVLTATYPDGADVTDDEAALSSGSSNAGTGNTLATVTLLVNEAQAARLAALEKNAVLHTALVVRGNDVKKAEVLAAQESFFLQDTPEEESATPETAPETEPSAESNTPEPQPEVPAPIEEG